MKEMDLMAVKEFGLTVEELMNQAGKSLAEIAVKFLKELGSRKVLILAGKGNNGGDAINAGKHLLEKGFAVKLFLAFKESELKELPKKMLAEFKALKGTLLKAKELEKALAETGLIIDGLLGFGLRKEPSRELTELMAQANQSGKFILAVDLPSGLPASGQPFKNCIKAQATLTLALPKKSFLSEQGKNVAGKTFLADIGFPEKLYEEFGFNKKELFQGRKIIEVTF